MSRIMNIIINVGKQRCLLFVRYHYRIMIIEQCSLSVRSSELNISAAKSVKNPEKTGAVFRKHFRASETMLTVEKKFSNSHIPYVSSLRLRIRNTVNNIRSS